MDASDEDLARAAIDGDAAAFGALLERVYDGIFGLAFRLTGRRDTAEDLTQDICAALPSKLAGFRGQARLRTWLWRITINAAHDMRRRSATQQRARDGWGAWEQNRRAADAQDQQAADWLHQAMQSLPDTLRDTLALVLDDITHAEAGEILGVSEGTISWRMAEARKQLRAMRLREDQE